MHTQTSHRNTTRNTRARILSGSAAILAMALAPVHADLTWGPGGAGGSGTWIDDDVTLNWFNGANVDWQPGNLAIFGGTAGAVTVSGTIAGVNGMTFNTDAYTLSGGTLTLAAPTISVGSGLSATVGSALAGTSGLTATGGGTLRLTGAAVNTLTGTYTIDAGSTLVTVGDAFSATGNAVVVNGTLDLSSTATLASGRFINNLTGNGIITSASSGGGDTSLRVKTGDFAGTIQDGGAGKRTALLFQAAGGLLNLSGTNLYTGDTLIREGGILRLSSAGALPANSFLRFAGTSATLELNDGNFTRTLGGSTGNGGVFFEGGTNSFASLGADRTVTINGALVWGTLGFTPGALGLGSVNATHKTTFTSAINLNNAARTIDVPDGPAAIEGELTGALTGNGTNAGTATLIRTGAGHLRVSAPIAVQGLRINGGITTFATGSSYTGDAYFSIGTGAGLGGTVNLTGAVNFNPNSIAGTARDFNVADVNGSRGILNIQTTGTVTAGTLYVGKSGTAVGVLNQSSGTLVNNAGGEWRIGGGSNGQTAAYGIYNMTGGTLTTGVAFQVGGYGLGVMNVSAGTVNTGSWTDAGRFNTSNGVINMSGGTWNQTGAGHRFFVAEEGTGVLNLTGGALNSAGGFTIGNTGTANGTLNLLGGITTAQYFRRAGGTGNLYMNGGTIRARANEANFMSGLSNAVLGPNGITIDTNNVTITASQAISSPGGAGLTSIPLATGGAGYAGNPIVQITGGGGTGATAVANIADGVVTGFTITNPGSGYTSAPVITLLGGGATTAATAGTATLAANAASGALTKMGPGTLVLTGQSTYTGVTAIRSGTLSLEFETGAASADLLAPTSTLRLYGGALSVVGKSSTATSQTFAGATFDPGHSTLATTAGGGGTLAVNLGAITRNAGSSVDLTPGIDATIATSTPNNAGGILGGFATVNAFDWATVSGGNVVALTNYQTSSDATTWAATDNVQLLTTPFPALAGSATVSSLKFDADADVAIPAGQTLTLASGGVLVTSGVANIFGGGTLKGAAGADLVVHQTSVFPATISSIIADNGSATGLTKTGFGTLVLGGVNTYTGNTFLNAGTLEAGVDANLGAGTTVTARAGTTLRISGIAPFASAKDFQFDAGTSGALPSPGFGPFAPGTFVVDVTNTAGATISGVFNLNNGTLTKTGEGILTLTNGGINQLARLEANGAALNIENGGLVLNGGPGSVWNVVGGELTVGNSTPTAASLTVQSGTLNVATFLSAGRGNGTAALASTINVTGGTVNALNLFTGYAAGVSGYNAEPVINIGGTGVVNVTNTAANSGIRLGESFGGKSTLNLAGSAILTDSGDFQAGFGGRALITVADSATLNLPRLTVGYGTNVAGNLGAAAFRQTGGTVQQAGGFGGDWRIGGVSGANDSLVYGSYAISGGALTTGRNIQIGAYGRGIMDISGTGSVTTTDAYPVVGRFAGGVGQLDIRGGSFHQNTAGTQLIIGEQGIGVVNLSGSGLLTVAGAPGAAGNGGGTGGIRLGHVAGGIGLLNVNGGTVTATGIAKSAAAGVGAVYLNGGTVKAGAANATYLQGLDAAIVGPGGAVFDTNGFDITVGQTLTAPTGSGVSAIAIADGGIGYLGSPIVQITGDGVGATAVANIDTATGLVTGITITNPGIGYTTAPTVTLLGGGATIDAIAGVADLAANATTGGLTKNGAGKLTISASNAYGGLTQVTAGTLQFTASQTLPGGLNIADGATVILGSGSPAPGDFAPPAEPFAGEPAAALDGAPAIAAVPEPGSAGLLGIGVLGLLARRRRAHRGAA